MAKSAEAFRTISEVSDWLETPAHVLRFWESRFSQVKPVKRAGGRRYYRPTDMLLLGGIRRLLHDDGITIKGVQKIMREKGVKYVSSLSADLPEAGSPDPATKPRETTPIVEILTVGGDASNDRQTQADDAEQSDAATAPQTGADAVARGSRDDASGWGDHDKNEGDNLFAEAKDNGLEDGPDANLLADSDDENEDDGHAAKAARHIRFGQANTATDETADDTGDSEFPQDRVAALYSRLKSLRDRVERDMRRG